MTLRIGIDATTWWNDRGFGRFTRELVKALASRASRAAGGPNQFRYTLVIDRARWPEADSSLPPGVEVLGVASSQAVTEAAVGSSSRSPADMWQLSTAVRHARFDAFFFPAVYSYYPLFARTPCIVTFHDTIPERFPKLVFPTRANQALWTVKTALAKLQCTRAMTVSRASARDLHDVLGISEKRIDVVTEAADPAFHVLSDSSASAAMRTRFEIPSAVPLFTYVGGLNPHKNLMSLLRAFPALIARHPNAHLAIVGDTSGKGFFDNVDELRTFVAAHPELQKRVRFTGYISDPELVLLFNTSNALVLPSLLEGFGLPAVEAMQCGLPVLASNTGSLPEVVADAGMFFAPTAPDEIAATLSRFLDNPALQGKLRAAALARAATFTWERGAELAEQSFLKCVGR